MLSDLYRKKTYIKNLLGLAVFLTISIGRYSTFQYYFNFVVKSSLCVSLFEYPPAIYTPRVILIGSIIVLYEGVTNIYYMSTKTNIHNYS